MRSLTSILLFLIFSFNLNAQLGNGVILTECTVCGLSGLITHDMDADGYKDILVKEHSKEQLLFYRNTGEIEEFSDPIVLLDDIKKFDEYFVQDLNADGWSDIILNSDSIVLLMNLGDNNFSAPELLSDLSYFYVFFKVADLNNDNFPDIIIGTEEEVNFQIFLNDGEANFTLHQEVIEQHTAVHAIEVVDINGDNLLDLIVGDADSIEDNFTSYQNDGTGSFISVQIAPAIGNDFLNFAFGDFTGDGIDDIVYLEQSTNTSEVDLITNNGTGIYTSQEIDPGPDGDFGHIRAADKDNDEDFDIFYTIGNGVYWLENDGFGIFSPSEILHSHAEKAAYILTEDMNLDGKIDVVSLSTMDNELAIMYQNSDGTFTTPYELKPRVGVSYMNIFDIDSDGDEDIIGIDRTTKETVFFENQSNGFSSPQLIPGLQQQDYPTYIFEDLNQDNLKEIIIRNVDSKNEVCFNEGDGNFSAPMQIVTEEDFTLFKDYPIQLNTDTYRFLLQDVSTYPDLSVHLGSLQADNTINHEFAFNIASTNQNPVQLHGSVIGDFNDDTYLDMAIAYELPFESTELAIYYGTEDGTFSEPQVIFQLPSTETIVNDLYISVADLNEDDFPDFLFGNDIDYTTYLLYSDGAGGYTQEFSFFQSISTVVTDFDHDGHLDLVADFYDEYRFFPNDGNGNFSESIFLWDYEYIYTPNHRLVDMTGDGDLDFITLNYLHDRVTVYTNQFNFKRLSGRVFWDENTDGVFSVETDEPMSAQALTLTPNELLTYPNQNGEYVYLVNGDLNYTLSFPADSCLQITTEMESYSVPAGEDNIADLDFGFNTSSSFVQVESILTSGPTRCGFTVPFWLNLNNSGCSPAAGKVGIITNGLADFIFDSGDNPDLINGDTLFWNFPIITPRSGQQFRFDMEINGPEFIGDYLNIEVIVFTEEEEQFIESSTYNFSSQINCAYDPNDKLVYPDRTAEFGETLTEQGEDIQYTIRFQNTGTDTAFNVVIIDQLDPLLDWSTFQPLAGSHSYEVLLRENGIIEFTFSNILLPDSTVNEVGSHGFISYNISQNPGLQIGDIIENTARIYFDFNPAIVTNTTQSFLANDVSISSKKVSPAQLYITAVPNPFNDMVLIKLEENEILSNAKVDITDITGRIIGSYNFTGNELNVNTGSFSQGIYFCNLIVNGKRMAQRKVVKIE